MDQLQEIQEINNEHVLIEIVNEEAEKEEHLLEGMTMMEESPDESLVEELEIVKIDTATKSSANKSSATKKRVSLTIEKKIEIIQRHEKGESQKSLSEEYHVGRTTISDILKRKYKFFKVYSKLNEDIILTSFFFVVRLNEF